MSPVSEPPSLLDDRYEIQALIGRGGMADVYEALDRTSGRKVALKQLLAFDDPDKRKNAAALFEREFHVLSQLAHPRIVEPYDYHVDSTGPHYTMELLDGGDLHALAPAPWREACSWMIDICSALSLLHSRRLVHRDLSPRNVRCTADGLAKLIDFGAMAPVGASQQLVGTPALCAPESLELHPLDARTDLYSLGATLYFTLTGRYAYPARDFRQLREMCLTPPRRPRELNPEVPEALDELVMGLIHLDPTRRPISAAEVMDRLGAVADVRINEQLLVSQAYLSTPALVGRERETRQIRRKLDRGLKGRGESIFVRGAPGTGRSRFLDSCLLQAKLMGGTTLRVNPSLCDGSDFSAVRSLAEQVLAAQPDLARRAAESRLSVLGYLTPKLLEGRSDVELEAFEGLQQRRARLQPVVREWFIELSHERPLVIAADDLQLLDEPSAACLALLSHEVRAHPIVLLCTADWDIAPELAEATELLAQRSAEVALEPFEASDTADLLRSVFGAVPHIDVVAHRIHSVAGGNVRDTLELAQHLVDRRVVRYQEGVWQLPSSIDTDDLPSSLAQTLQLRVDTLDADSLELAQAMALSPDQNFAIAQCAELTGHQNQSRLFSSLKELIAPGIIRSIGGGIALSQPGWIAPLRARLSEDTARQLHLRLAALMERTGDGIRAAAHLLAAGEDDRGVTTLVQAAARSQAITDTDPDAYYTLIQNLPPDWMELFLTAIDHCQSSGRPARDLFTLRHRLCGLLSTKNIDHPPTADGALDQLYRDTGLDIYERLDASLGPKQRIHQALGEAQARYEAAAPDERVFAPGEAIRPMARVLLQTIPPVVYMQDYARWEAFPSVAPLTPLSPALWVIEKIREGLGFRVSGRLHKMRSIYTSLLERTAEPDRAGLDPTYHRHTVLTVQRAIGAVDAYMGLDVALDSAARLASDPFYGASALFVRMLYHLWQGDAERADTCRREVDLLRIQNSPPQVYEVHLLAEVAAHAAAEDLVRLKQSLVNVEAAAQRYAGWIPIAHFTRGAYRRARGKLEAAAHEFEQALELALPGRHQIWADAAWIYLDTLNALGRHEEARAIGERYLAAARQSDALHGEQLVKMPLAVAHAHLGEGQRARDLSGEVVQYFEELGSTGLNAGHAYLARATVAKLLGEEDDFHRFAALCGTEFGRGGNRTLAAKHERLVQRPGTGDSDGIHAPVGEDGQMLEKLASVLSACVGRHDRAERRLELLVETTQVVGGFLYVWDGGELARMATVGRCEPPPDLDERVNAYLRRRMSEVGGATLTANGLPTCIDAGWTVSDGHRYHPVLLDHHADGSLAITGVVVLVAPPDVTLGHPTRILTAISRGAATAGDVVPLVVS